MKKIIVFIATIFFAISPAHADKNEKINELINNVNNRAALDAVKTFFPQLLAPIECGFQLDEAGKQALNDEMEKAFQSYAEKITDFIKPYYEETFTEAEIDEILAFYKSKPVQKLMALTPVIMENVLPQTQSLNQELTINFMTAANEIVKNYPEKSEEELKYCMQQKQRSL